MRWKGRRQSNNIDDQRGGGGGMGGGFRMPGGFGRGGGGGPVRIPIGAGSGGGLSISTIVILVVLFFALRACGIDPLEMLNGGPATGGGGTVTQQQQQSAPGGSQAGANDETRQFVATVLAETEDVWNGIFQAQGQKYREPTLTLFSGQVNSACGQASAAVGPFYCPNDQKVYLDTDFFTLLDRQFGASGDFAQAYVIAHEVGHHVQNILGTLPEFNRQRQGMSEGEANEMSVRIELQADCYAGIWGHFTEQKGILERGDLDEALNAATRIGDDALQQQSQGYVVPDSFTHGSSEQRRTWFQRGFESGRLADCDTLNARI